MNTKVIPPGYVESNTSASGLQLSEEERAKVAAASAAIAALNPTIGTWAIFNEARLKYIQYAVEVEGKTFDEIADILSCDSGQIDGLCYNSRTGFSAEEAYHVLYAKSRTR